MLVSPEPGEDTRRTLDQESWTVEEHQPSSRTSICSFVEELEEHCSTKGSPAGSQSDWCVVQAALLQVKLHAPPLWTVTLTLFNCAIFTVLYLFVKTILCNINRYVQSIYFVHILTHNVFLYTVYAGLIISIFFLYIVVYWYSFTQVLHATYVMSSAALTLQISPLIKEFLSYLFLAKLSLKYYKLLITNNNNNNNNNN